jgi:hypothetical protein
MVTYELPFVHTSRQLDAATESLDHPRMSLDPISASIASYVRELPDEDLLELIKVHLGPAGFYQHIPRVVPRPAPRVVAQPAPRAVSQPAPREEEEPAPSEPGEAATEAAPARQRRRVARDADFLADVERVVTGAPAGIALADITRALSASDKGAVAAALKALRAQGRVVSIGERRLARWAPATSA